MSLGFLYFQTLLAAEHVRSGLIVRYTPKPICHMEGSQSCATCQRIPGCKWCRDPAKATSTCIKNFRTCTSPVRNCPVTPEPVPGSDFDLVVTLSVLGTILGLVGVFVAWHAIRHPASCPGQLLVRLRMFHYRITTRLSYPMDGDGQEGRLWERRASVLTADTSVN